MVDLLMKNVAQQNKNSNQCQGINTIRNSDEPVNDYFKCSQCQEIFRTLVAKKKHEKFYHYFKKPFVCECGQLFGKLSEVKYHVRRVHNNEKNYVCHVCNKAFFKNSDLVIHQNVHESSAKFICEDCGRRFKHVSNLIRHSRTHTGIKPYLCLPCNKRFSQVAALRQHEMTEKHKEKVANKNVKNGIASMANGTLENEQGLKSSDDQVKFEEQKNENGKRKWWFYCKICGERFPFSVLLRDHETKHIANKDIKCNSCKEEFTSIKVFNSHACSNNLEPSKIVATGPDTAEEQVTNSQEEAVKEGTSLEDCGEDKKVELTLTQNGQIILDNDEVLLTLNDKVYGLLLINNDVTVVEDDKYLHILNNRDQDVFDVGTDLADIEGVLDLGNLQTNSAQEEQAGDWQWTNVSIKNDCDTQVNKSTENQIGEIEKTIAKHKHKCTECGKEFGKKSNYLHHLGTHFVKFQKHKCQECEKNFFWSSSLRNHMLKKHSKKTEYPCLRCGKKYYSSLLVQHHVKRDHLNIRSHKCTVCEKTFFRRYDLKVHIRIHTDERPYICGVCGKRFRHLSHSIRHDKTHLKNALREKKS